MITTTIIHHSSFPIHQNSTPIPPWFRYYDVLDDRLDVLDDGDLIIDHNETIGPTALSYRL